MGEYEAEVKEKSDPAFLYKCDLLQIVTALNFETLLIRLFMNAV